MASKFKDSGIWYIKYKDLSGAWRNISCGPSATTREAELLRQKYDAEEFNRRHHAAIRPVKANLNDCLERFKDQEIPRSNTGRPKGRKSIVREKAIIKALLAWCVKNRIDSYIELTTDRMKQFFDVLYRDKRAPTTIAKYRQILVTFFKWSMENMYCQASPMTVIRNPKRDRKPPRFFSRKELKIIFKETRQPYRNIFKFLYLTGLRIGELGNAEWSHYIEHLCALRIPVMEGNKTKRECMLPLNKSALRILKQQKAARDSPDSQKYIFVNAIGGKLDNANIYRALMKVLNKLKISDATCHTFRHTCASHLVIKGISLYIVKEILRHASIKETEVYSHLSREAVCAGIEQLKL